MKNSPFKKMDRKAQAKFSKNISVNKFAQTEKGHL